MKKQTSRRIPLPGLLIALLIFSSVGGYVLLNRSQASTETTNLVWMVTGSNVNKIKQDDPALATYHFSQPKAYLTGNEDGAQNQVPAGLAAVPTLKYESYARFESDVNAGRIDPSIKAIIYDPENWDATPVNEKQDPKPFLRAFGTLAKSKGYYAITTPARDLMQVTGGLCTKGTGETLSQAFIRCNIASAAAETSDMTQYQSQSEQSNTSAFRSSLTAVRNLAKAANPNVVFAGGLSTSPFGGVATAQQLMDAHNAGRDLVAGWYFTICNSCAGEMATAQDFLRQVRDQEQSPSTPPPPTPTFAPEDINMDGAVNILDFSLLSSKFGTTTNLGRADINSDGKVNIIDFSLLAAKFSSA